MACLSEHSPLRLCVQLYRHCIHPCCGCCACVCVQEYWSDKLTHAFCLEARQCKQVAELVYASVTNSLPHLAAVTPHSLGPEHKLAAAAAAALAEAASKDTQQQQADQAAAGAVDMDLLVSEEPSSGQGTRVQLVC
jgi:hypothetical protein